MIELLELLNNLEVDADFVDPADVSLHLQSYRERFLNLLRFKGSNPESRKQVEDLLVTTNKYGEQRLDADPDKKLALLMSDELKLDEVLCVEYLITASDERGSFTVEAAAGLYFEERQATLKCLLKLLADVAGNMMRHESDGQGSSAHQNALSRIFYEFISDLLSERSGGQSGPQMLLSRMIELLKDNSLEPSLSSAGTYLLPEVRDEAGIMASRAMMLQLERRLLCKCMLMALFVNQRAAPKVVGDLVDLLGVMSSKAKGTGSGDPFLSEQLQLVMLCCSLALTPQEERGSQEKQQLEELVANSAVKEKVAPPTQSSTSVSAAGTGSTSTAPPGESWSAVLRLSWGLLATGLHVSSSGSMDEAKRNLVDATAAGAFEALGQVFSCAYFKLDDSVHQELVACIVFRLVGMFLQADVLNMSGALCKTLLDRCNSRLKRSPQGSADISLPLAHVDHAGTVLAVLAALFKVFPQLWLIPEQSCVGDARSYVEGFISRTVMHEMMRKSPEVRVSFLDMMSALCCGEYGAAMVLRQFNEMGRTPLLEVLSWRKQLGTIIEYCVRYNHVLAEAARSGNNVSLTVAARVERLMNTQEAEILVSFLNLVKQIIEQGAEGDVRGFLESSERDLATALSGYPLYEPLFQLMCHPVPNTVKAALDQVLAALGTRFPRDYAPRLLERLMQCSAIIPNSPMVPGVPRLDLITQINEVEARKEEYPETIAFIRLLNALLLPVVRHEGMAGGAAGGSGGAANGGSGNTLPAVARITDGGMDLMHLTAFIVQHVLAHLWQRGYRIPTQKWEIAAHCFQHLELMLELCARSSLPPHPDASARQPPGYVIMHDALGGGPVMQSLMHILSPGYADLMEVRTQSDIVAPREMAVVAGLRVMVALLQMDRRFLDELEHSSGHCRYQSLDVHMRAPPKLSNLLAYICYPDSMDIQIEALRIATELTRRLPNTVELLQHPSLPSGTLPSIRRGYAVALRQSLFQSEAIDNLSDAPLASMCDSSDPRAALILALALQNAAEPTGSWASFTHMMLGYEVEVGSMGGISESMLLPKAEYSVLTIIEKALVHQGFRFSRSKPKLYSQMLCLLYRMASLPSSSVPMLEYLAPKNQDLAAALTTVLVSELAPSNQTHDLAASLHQRSFILRIQALLLLRLEHPESAQRVLVNLLGPIDSGPDMATELMPTGSCALLNLLAGLVDLEVQQPALSDAGLEERRLWQEMVVSDVSIEALLSQPHALASVGGSGVQMQSDTGDVLFDVSALYPLLMQRYDQYTARSGLVGAAASDLPSASVKAALRYVQQYNAHALVSGARAAAVEAWAHLVQVCFTRLYSQLTIDGQATLVAATSPAEALFEILTASLEGTSRLLASGDATLSPMLCTVVRTLLSKLQEQVVVNMSLGQASDPLAPVRVPPRCHALLRLLLDLMQRARRLQPVRVQLYAALLQYLQFCRGSKLSSCAPVVLEAMLEGWGGSSTMIMGSVAQQLSSSVAKLDATQDAIERGNAALLNEHGPMLVQLLTADALDASAPHLQQSVALHLLSSLVAHQPSTAAMMYSHSVPQTILQQLTSTPQQLLLQNSKQARVAVYVVEAQLALLLRLSQAGPPHQRQLSAQQMYSLHVLQYIGGCKALDFEPEDPSMLRGNQMTDSLRYRLHHLITPLMRLLHSVVASLPDSTSVKSDACQFVEGHYRMMERQLREAASPGAGAWVPGDAELEQAQLSVSLLSRLVPVWHELHPSYGEGLRHALYRLTSVFCCANSKSVSPIVVGLTQMELHCGQRAGINRASVLTRTAQISALRCSLARYLRDSVVYSGHAASAKDGSGTKDSSAAKGHLLMKCLGAGGGAELDAQTARPSLMLIRDMAEQSCVDASSSLEELASLLDLLKTPDLTMDEATCVSKIQEYGPSASCSTLMPLGSGGEESGAAHPDSLFSRRRLTRHYVAMAASKLDHLLGSQLSIVENSLAIVLLHFLRCLPRGSLLSGGAGVSKGALVLAAGARKGENSMQLDEAAASLELMSIPEPTEEDALQLGSRGDLVYFMSRLQETLLKTESLLCKSDAIPHHSVEGIDLMLRTLKSYVISY